MYRAGWGRQEIAIEPKGYAMQGYGMWQHRARGVRSPLHARALYLEDDNGNPLIFCCLDLGYVTHAMRSGVCAVLQAEMGTAFRESSLVLTCTHTHSGPGGCSHDVMYNIVTPGFVPGHVEKIVEAASSAILQAWHTAAPASLGLATGALDDDVPVAWNRSLSAYNRNPEVTRRTERETHLALDRGMSLLSLRRDGQLQALLSLFGVHATCVGNSLHQHDGDNKGYAALQAEACLRDAGARDAVAIFAQATAGDVSPHYHGPGDIARRRAISGDAEYAYAERNGRLQSDHALSVLAQGQEERVAGGIDSIMTYVDFTDVTADPEFANGRVDACTSEPCHGVSFFAGTRVDGPGMPAALARVSSVIANGLRRYRLGRPERFSREDQAYYRRLYAAQGPKAILMETGRKVILGQPVDRLRLPGFVDPVVGEMKRQAQRGAMRQSAMVPTVLPLQIVVVGQVAVVCCPGEFTTVAGERVRQVVAGRLRDRGVRHVLVCTYCNEYMGYVTTNEEYQEQAYEGGHTIFGQWTLAAFQTRFAGLAAELLKPESAREHDRVMRPAPVPAEELALRTNLPVPH